ncbi:hypothetical protein IV454_07480 [Massilia antarctica]|uniref:Uncharacterized protein n=1 Tax=Massilia antarctica TaxID=2765360 RepID=A0AA48WGS0_9BURK|nr:hypothetical protein [Massilia antarctica]QPI51352.1 hypothetical protein IV454_07480 [Massilia antarctica]
MGCEAIGSYRGARRDFVDFVLGIDADGSCQQVRVSSSSSGPVHDDETLARFVFAPAHTTPTGDIDETFVLDAFKYGASVQRLQVELQQSLPALHRDGEAHAERIRRGSPDRAPQPERTYLGVVTFVAAQVRAVHVDVTAARIRVYDTALPDDQLHADIVASDIGLTKALRKELRVRLFLLAWKSGLFPSPVAEGGTPPVAGRGC